MRADAASRRTSTPTSSASARACRRMRPRLNTPNDVSSARRRKRHAASVNRHVACGLRLEPADRTEDVAGARSELAGEPDDRAARSVEVEPGDAVANVQPANAHTSDPLHRRGVRGWKLPPLFAEHHLDEIPLGELRQ